MSNSDQAVIFNHEQHIEWLMHRIGDKPVNVTIASYGVYAGITYTGDDSVKWGDGYHLYTRDFIDALRDAANVRMLIGVSDYKSCKGKHQCLHCEKQYIKMLLRLVNHADHFDKFKWKMTNRLYSKAYIFEYDDQLIGLSSGRNLSDSDHIDCSIVLSSTSCHVAMQYINDLWSQSDDISSATISDLLVSQNISDEGIEAIFV